MTCCINTFLFLEDFNANVFFSFKSCSNFISAPFILSLLTEAVSRRCSLKHLCWSLLFNKVVVGWKVFLKISQNSQENTYVKVFFLMNLQACSKQHRCVPISFTKFLRTHLFIQNLRQMLLYCLKDYWNFRYFFKWGLLLCLLNLLLRKSMSGKNINLCF